MTVRILTDSTCDLPAEVVDRLGILIVPLYIHVDDRDLVDGIDISRDECLKHAEFRDKEGIGTELLSDMEGVVCKQYGVWQAREVDGHRKFGIARSTFIIDKSGVIRHALYNVNYKGHALEVLRLVKEMNS